MPSTSGEKHPKARAIPLEKRKDLEDSSDEEDEGELQIVTPEELEEMKVDPPPQGKLLQS